MMKKLLFVALPFLIWTACKQAPQESAETARDVKAYTIEQFMNTTKVGGASFSPDGKKIAFHSNKSGIYNVYTLPVDGGEPQPLTNSSKESNFLISYFPDNERILFAADQGGNEKHHIYLREIDGTVKDLTPEDAKASFYGWSHDRKSFFIGSNKRNEKFFDVYEMNINDFEPVMIYQNDSGYNVSAISNDKNYFALVKSNTTNDNNMYLFDRNTKELKYLSLHTGDATYNPQEFSNDNRYLYYITNEGDDFSYLSRYDIATGEKTKLIDKDWDIQYSYFSHNGRYQVTGINEDAKTVIEIKDTKTGKMVDFPDLGAGDIKGIKISDDEKQMAFYVGSSRIPNDLYIYEFESGNYKRLTNSTNSEIDENDLVEGQVVRFKSYDGLEIPSILYKPHQASANNKVPALVWVHGGPGGQSRLNYSPMMQYLINHGYAILAVNNRGSSGYGKEFYAMDDKKHGDADLGDIVESKNYLGSLDFVDTSKVGVMGGSYGGYMTMAALAFRPDVFDVGVNVFGVTNWLRTLNSIPPWWESFRNALYTEMGDPKTDSLRLYNISPLFHADKIEKPFIVLQGANDPRVLQVESDEMVNAARANNVEVDYVLFPDEGHGFMKKENEIEGYKRVLNFLNKHLKGAEPVKG